MGGEQEPVFQNGHGHPQVLTEWGHGNDTAPTQASCEDGGAAPQFASTARQEDDLISKFGRLVAIRQWCAQKIIP